MPFKDTYLPEELEVLQEALKDHCAALGIVKGSADYENAAALVMRFYNSGIIDKTGLMNALTAHRLEGHASPEARS